MPVDRKVQTQALAVYILYKTGRYPTIERHEGYNQIILDSDQIEQAKEYLTELMESGPGEVRIEVNNIILPVLFKKYWPWLIGVPVGLTAIGFMLSQKK